MRVRSLLLFVFLMAAVLDRGFARVSIQDPDHRPSEIIKIVRPLEPEFNALLLRFGAAVKDYDDTRLRMSREQSKSSPPPHPAKSLLGEFRRLADEKDSGGAQGWILENLEHAVDAPEQRLALARQYLPPLLANHSGEDSVLHAIEGLRAVRADLGEETLVEMAISIADATRVDEILGQAKLLLAFARTEGDTTKDPARWEEANEIYREILFTIPKTRAGKQVSGILHGQVAQEFYRREREWVDTLVALQKAGEPPENWPRQPMHDLVLDYQPLANAGHKSAASFVNQLYPSFEQVERQGIGFAYAWLVNKIGEFYGDGVDGPWNTLRSDLLAVVYRQYPTERWVFDSLRKLVGQVEFMPREPVVQAMESLLAKNEEPRVRSLALFAMAQTIKASGDQESYAHAIELFTRVRDEYPDEPIRQAAEGGRAELAPVMPGQPALPTRLDDAEGLPMDLARYQGRVVMLEFWSFYSEPFLEGIPARQSLVERYQDRPFTLLGINTDNRQSRAFHDLATKHGVRWRCASTYSTNALIGDWAIRKSPSTLLIDKGGIIRARDLPWARMLELAETLVREAEEASGSQPPK